MMMMMMIIIAEYHARAKHVYPSDKIWQERIKGTDKASPIHTLFYR